MAGLDDFRTFTNTPKRRHNFYCYSTKAFIQEQAIFFLLVEAYRKERRKRQAVFLNEWFIKGNIPQDLLDGGYLSELNISSADRREYGAAAGGAVSAVGRSFADKAKNHGGGVSGFFGALRQKAGDTKLAGDIFDEPQMRVVEMLHSDGDHGFGDEGGAGARFRPDHSYQPFGGFANKVQKFRSALKEAGFDADAVGIY